MRGRPRTPLAKLQANGAIDHDPKRFKDRREPKARPIGEPSKGLSKNAVKYWHAFCREASWFTEADRGLLEQACIFRARSFSRKGLSDTAVGKYIAILSRLGLTPTDRQRVNIPDGCKSQTVEDYLN